MVSGPALTARLSASPPASRSSSTMGQVGRQLAVIGDDINRRYDSEFQTMLKHLQPTAENAYELFTKIASRYPWPRPLCCAVTTPRPARGMGDTRFSLSVSGDMFAVPVSG